MTKAAVFGIVPGTCAVGLIVASVQADADDDRGAAIGPGGDFIYGIPPWPESL